MKQRKLFKTTPASIIICLLVALFSCKNKPEFLKFNNRKVAQLQQLLKVNPDSALKLSDQLLHDSLNNKFSTNSLIEIYTIRKEAYRQLLNSDAIYECADKIIQLAATVGDSATIAVNMLELNNSNVDFQYLKNAEKYLPGSIRYFQQNGKKYEAAICKLLYGSVLENSEEFKTAQKYFLEVYDIFGELDSFKAQSKVCISIAGLYADMGSMNESSKYYRESYQIAKKYNDSIRQSVALSNLGINYRRTKPDTALLLYKQALSLLPYNATFSRRMKVEFNMANLYLDQNQHQQAAVIYNQLLDYGLKNSSSEVISIAYNGLAAVYVAQNKYDKAKQYYQKALHLMDSLGQVKHAMRLIPEMIELHKLTNDLPKVVALYDRKIKLSDSLLNADKQIAVHELATKYQTEKKELENKALKNRLWNIKMYILFFTIAMIIFFILWRQRVRLIHERAISYEILMAKYRAEKEVGDRFLQFKINPHTIPALVDDTPVKDERALIDQLNEYFVTNKPYLNPRLKLEDIAVALNASQKEINKIFKDNNIPSFYAFVNQYRVEETRRLFEDPANQHLKLDAIAAMAGFGTKQTFYSAFMQFTGVNPGYYRKNILSD